MIEINGHTRTCGLIGNPVEHTLSPLIHNYLADKMDKNMVYVPFAVEEGRLEDAVKGAFGLNILGCNVTVPYKNAVIPYLAEVDELAAKMGSVNTLVRTQTGYKGYNTDMTGLYRAMCSDGVSIEGEQVVVLGAGGVGRAVAFMCAAKGAEKVWLLNRTLDKAQTVAEEVNRAEKRQCVCALAIDEYGKLPDRKYLVIQSTSVGLYPHVNDAVITDDAFYQKVKAGYDLIYRPWETRFMKLVKAQGAPAYNGLKMLLYQGVEAFEMWNQCKIEDESAYKVYELLKTAVVR